MSQFIKEYRLKQITPMLHFQYNQPGATLRASEVKPKLDKFLCECYKSTILADWCIKSVEDSSENRTPALNYKMSIFCEEGKWHVIEKDNSAAIDSIKPPMYFGEQQNARLVIFDSKEEQPDQRNPIINLQIKCMNQKLREFIDEHIKDFFILHNFGMRQSKGYGGFLVLNEKDELPTISEINDCIKRYYANKKCIYFEYKKGQECIPSLEIEIVEKCNKREDKKVLSCELKKCILDKVANVYSLMKTGINLTNGKTGIGDKNADYVKGYIMSFRNETAGNDKAFLKKISNDPKRYFNDMKEHGVNHIKYEYRRAMLGLHGDYYLQGKKYIVKVRHLPKTVNGKKKEKIERFMSPVLIKLFECFDGNRVYIFPPRKDEYSKLLSEVFSVSIEEPKQKGCIAKTLVEGKLSTPDSFSYNDFFEYVVNEYNEKKSWRERSTKLKGRFAGIELKISPTQEGGAV